MKFSVTFDSSKQRGETDWAYVLLSVVRDGQSQARETV